MSITPKLVPAADFLDYATGRGLRHEPVTNSIQAAQEGVPLRVVAYKLLGPRGSHKTVGMDANGLLDLDTAALYADGVDYATARIAAKAGRGR